MEKKSAAVAAAASTDSSSKKTAVSSSPPKCFSCQKENGTLECAACQNIWYCSETCKKNHWKKHKTKCCLAKVCVIEGDHIQERDYALFDINESQEWQKCKVPALFGIPLMYKKLSTKRPKANKLGQVLRVEPDENLVNEVFKVVNDKEDEDDDDDDEYECDDDDDDDDDDDIEDYEAKEMKMVIKHADPKIGFVKYEWSKTAWRVDKESDKLGTMMFARADRKDLNSNDIYDLFITFMSLWSFTRAEESRFRASIAF
jgi:hypothetical protein